MLLFSFFQIICCAGGYLWVGGPRFQYPIIVIQQSTAPPILLYWRHILFFLQCCSVFIFITNIETDKGKNNDNDKTSYVRDTSSFSYNVALYLSLLQTLTKIKAIHHWRHIVFFVAHVAHIYLFYLSLPLETLTKTKTMKKTRHSFLKTYFLFCLITNIFFQIFHVHFHTID